MTELAIETADLGKRYGKVWALRHCSIEVPAGRVSGLVGANGAGKTTLMRMLAGLSRPTVGSARIVGRAPEDTVEFCARSGTSPRRSRSIAAGTPRIISRSAPT